MIKFETQEKGTRILLLMMKMEITWWWWASCMQTRASSLTFTCLEYDRKRREQLYSKKLSCFKIYIWKDISFHERLETPLSLKTRDNSIGLSFDKKTRTVIVLLSRFFPSRILRSSLAAPTEATRFDRRKGKTKLSAIKRRKNSYIFLFVIRFQGLFLPHILCSC